MSRPRRRGPPAFDFRRFAKGIAGPDLDSRHWVSYGTVASVNGEDGTPNFTDPNAVVVTPAGVEVDVVLEPSGYPITCRHGIAAGAVYICGPIRPGDQVIVGVPDGDSSMVPEIFKVIPGSSDPIPVGDDGMPVFQNDRFLIMSQVPIEIRSTDGTMVRITDGLVELGGAGATEQVVEGTTYRSNEDSMLTTWKAAMQLAASACHSATNPATTMAGVQAVAGMLDSMVTALDSFQGGADSYLSRVVKTK